MLAAAAAPSGAASGSHPGRRSAPTSGGAAYSIILRAVIAAVQPGGPRGERTRALFGRGIEVAEPEPAEAAPRALPRLVAIDGGRGGAAREIAE